MQIKITIECTTINEAAQLLARINSEDGAPAVKVDARQLELPGTQTTTAVEPPAPVTPKKKNGSTARPIPAADLQSAAPEPAPEPEPTGPEIDACGDEVDASNELPPDLVALVDQFADAKKLRLRDVMVAVAETGCADKASLIERCLELQPHVQQLAKIAPDSLKMRISNAYSSVFPD